jgi:3'-phosphoadenosine 5'-phosphosulfate sulfotransferase (PAPS reductase)/FAD synthetase
VIPEDAWLILTDNTDLAYNVLVGGRIIGDLVFDADKWSLRESSRATDAPKYFPPEIVVDESVKDYVLSLGRIRGPWVYPSRPVSEGEYVVFKCGSIYGLAQCTASIAPKVPPPSSYALRIVSTIRAGWIPHRMQSPASRLITEPFRLSRLNAKFRHRIGTAISANLKTLTELESKALKRIDEAVKSYPGRPLAVSFSGGKDSALVTELLRQYALKMAPGRKMSAFFADTSIEFPETYQYTRAFFTDSRYSMFELVMERPEKDFYEMWEEFGPPSRYARWCCGTQKLGPINAILKRFGTDVIVFNGTRAGESISRSRRTVVDTNPYVDGQIAVQPVLDWSLLEVWLYTFWRDVLVNPLYGMGFNRTGCYACPYSSDSILWTVSQTHPALMKRMRRNLAKYGIDSPNHDWRFRGKEILGPENLSETEACGGNSYMISARVPMLLDLRKVSAILKNKYTLVGLDNSALVFRSARASVTLSRSGRFLVRGPGGKKQAERIYQEVMSFIAASERSCRCVGCQVTKK